jgi:hypothetical protein
MNRVAIDAHAPIGRDVEGIELAARYPATTVLITASVAGGRGTARPRAFMRQAYLSRLPFYTLPRLRYPSTPRCLKDTCAGLVEGAAGRSLLLTDVEDMPAIVQDRLIDNARPGRKAIASRRPQSDSSRAQRHPSATASRAAHSRSASSTS